MYVIRFSPMRAVEFTDFRAFEQRIGRWLLHREAENCYILGQFPAMLNRVNTNPPGTPLRERLFVVEEGEQLLAAGVLFASGCLCMTWATDQMIDVLAEFMANAGCTVNSIYAPGHISRKFAERWAELTQQRYELGRSERIYQLAKTTYEPPETGRLEKAAATEKALVRPWIEAFMRETEFEVVFSLDHVVDELVGLGSLYLWKNPQPVSMVAWLSPTPNGGSINFVYTPPELRGKGHAKAAVAALGTRMLRAGRKYCFILTDTQDRQTNQLYQSVGARTICELLRCTIQPRIAPQQEQPLQRNSLVSA